VSAVAVVAAHSRRIDVDDLDAIDWDGMTLMRRNLLALLCVIAPLTAANAGIGIGPFEANDTGGIIAWSPQAQRYAREIAVGHCAQYGKRASITSVYARYGDYIAFACYFQRTHRHSRTVLRVRY
jgi:hypothetical protein